MERLWSPWRMKYILSEKTSGCIFCEKIASEEDRENYVLYRGERACIMLNLYPYNNGHLMVIPYQHESSLEGLDEPVLSELMNLVNKCLRALRRTMKPHGFNIGLNIGKVAGAGVREHVHIHVVPRWEGDTSFMPVLARTKVIPELLEETYDKLSSALREG
jgi:ATP adenylyltransferase